MVYHEVKRYHVYRVREFSGVVLIYYNVKVTVTYGKVYLYIVG